MPPQEKHPSPYRQCTSSIMLNGFYCILRIDVSVRVSSYSQTTSVRVKQLNFTSVWRGNMKLIYFLMAAEIASGS